MLRTRRFIRLLFVCAIGCGAPRADDFVAPPAMIADGGVEGPAAVSTGPTRVGELSISQRCSAPGSANCVAVASVEFTDGTTDCTTRQRGGCEVRVCELDGGSPQHQTFESAGRVTIGGTLAGGLSFNPTTGYPPPFTYLPVQWSTRMWTGGETLSASADGDVVPAFAVTLVAPRDARVLEPACHLEMCGSASRAAPFTISWVGGESSGMEATFVSIGPGRSVVMTCALTSNPATISNLAMESLGETRSGYQTWLRVQPTRATTFTTGDWAVTFSASASGVRGELVVKPW